MWKHTEESNLKRNAYNDIYSGNSLDVCVCLTTVYIYDGSHWWHIVPLFWQVLPCLSTLIQSSGCPTDAKAWDSWIRHLSSTQKQPGQRMLSVLFLLTHQNCRLNALLLFQCANHWAAGTYNPKKGSRKCHVNPRNFLNYDLKYKINWH